MATLLGRVLAGDALTPASRERLIGWMVATTTGGKRLRAGLTAAWWLGLASIEPAEVEVTVPRNSHGRGGAGIRIRRRELDEQDVFEDRGLRVTGIALTVLEASARRGGGPKIMDSALQRRVGLADLQRAHVRNRGRYGATAARRMLEAAAGGARSEAERLVIQLLRGAGIDGWQANLPIGPYVIDIAFPGERVAIEIDGWGSPGWTSLRTRGGCSPRSAPRFRRADERPALENAPKWVRARGWRRGCTWRRRGRR